MAHSVSARKRIRQNIARNLRNKAQRSAFRTEIKRVLAMTSKGDVKAAEAELPQAMKRIDKAAKTLAIHPNAAARYKSRLHHAIARAKKSGVKKTETKKGAAK
ncbi:MAG: 30S ribosomal protein S20 [Planctomycetes bacterium]|nr:30S ribosomal protein S20 [Planctomycetota bacterium]